MQVISEKEIIEYLELKKASVDVAIYMDTVVFSSLGTIASVLDTASCCIPSPLPSSTSGYMSFKLYHFICFSVNFRRIHPDAIIVFSVSSTISISMPLRLL